MLCEVKGAAMRWYRKSMALVMTGYVLVVFGTAVFVRHHRPEGVELYTVAALPSLVLVAMFAVIGMYLIAGEGRVSAGPGGAERALGYRCDAGDDFVCWVFAQLRVDGKPAAAVGVRGVFLCDGGGEDGLPVEESA